MGLLYPIFIRLYGFSINIFSFFNPKAKAFIEGRKKQKVVLKNISLKNNKRVLWHCASLGEYEQARPLIKAYQEKYPKHELFVSFFSPSGFEHAEIDTWISQKLYLPLDLKSRQATFLKALKPDAVFLLKYEIWPHLIALCKQQKIPIKLVCANFRAKQIYFKWYGVFFRKALQKLDFIFLQYAAIPSLTKIYPSKKISVIGDARFDKALNNVEQKTALEKIENFIGNKPVLILGSSWESEHQILKKALENEQLKAWKIIIAPHNVDSNSIKSIQNLFPSALLFSDSKLPEQIMVINQIGLLKNVYQYATLAFIGGGFTGKLHNTIEAAAFGCHLAFGEKHHRFPEAQIFINEGIATTIKTGEELSAVCEKSLTANNSTNQQLFKKYIGSSTTFKHLV